MLNLSCQGYRVLEATHDAECRHIDCIECSAVCKCWHTSGCGSYRYRHIGSVALYHFNNSMSDKMLQSEAKKHGSSSIMLRSIWESVASLGPEAISLLLVAHAVSGFGTVSALFGIRKTITWKRIQTIPNVRLLTDTPSCTDAEHSEVASAGQQLMVQLYGGKAVETLNHLQFTTYMTQLACSSMTLRPEP